MKKIITVYHGIGNDDKFMQVPINNFKIQIEYLKKKKFKFYHFEEFINVKKGNNIMIMFDDALKSSYEAIKYLEENKIKYSIAVIENNLDKDGYLTEIQLKKLKFARLYFHTKNHMDLCSVSKNELKIELTISKQYIAKDILVYPMGRYNKLVFNEMEKKGFKYGMTVLPFHVSKKVNNKEIPRICINGYLSYRKYKLFISTLGNIYLHLAFIKRRIFKQSYLEK